MADCSDGKVAMKIRDIEEFPAVYDTGEVLGNGRFGTIYKATHKDNGKTFAAKSFLCRRPSQRKEVDLEIELMSELKHEKLVSLFEAFANKKEAMLIMEIITGGELFDRIVDESFDLTEALASTYVNQICDGVGFMHSKNILHLDLKPENILCINPEKLDQVKIIDFGFARRYVPNQQLKVMYGTPEFVAPEVVNFDPLGPGTDMWSIGVITYVLLSGLSPFMGDDDLQTLSNVTGCEWDFEEECFDDISDNAKDFVDKLLQRQESKRLNCTKCLKHPWLSGEALKFDRKMSSRRSLVKTVARLKNFVARRKWARSITAVRAANRFQVGAKRNGESPSRTQAEKKPDDK